MSKRFKNPAATVDLIVPYGGGIILVERRWEPYKGKLALPGGYLECGEETLEEAGVRELFEETNLVARVENLKLVGNYSNPERDSRGHVISHAYEVTKVSGVLKAKDDAKKAGVYRIIPENLAFDHNKILSDYFKNRQSGELYEN